MATIGVTSPLLASLKLQRILSSNMNKQDEVRSKLLLNKNATSYNVDIGRARQSVDIETQLKSAKISGTVLKQNLEIANAMGDAVLEADTMMKEVIDLIKIADNAGTISTERAQITSKIRELGGDIYHLFQHTEHLGHRLLNEKAQPLTFNGAYGSDGSPALVVSFADNRLQTLHDTLDGIDLTSQSAAESALTTVQDLLLDEFGTIKATVLGVVSALTTEVSRNSAYQVSLQNRETAVQGINEDKLKLGLDMLERQSTTISEGIVNSNAASKGALSLLKSTPLELINTLVQEKQDDKQYPNAESDQSDSPQQLD